MPTKSTASAATYPDALPPLLSADRIRERLAKIFPEGTPQREHIIKPITAKAVFAALYVGAVAPRKVAASITEGTEDSQHPDADQSPAEPSEPIWMALRHLYRMTDAIANKDDVSSRIAFYLHVPRSSEASWYADNSRETGRDEGVRQGLIPLNAMVKRTDIMTNSMKGRYALHPDFATLLDPHLEADVLAQRIQDWRAIYLTPAALMRAALADQIEGKTVTVNHPQGGSTVLPYGGSPELTKAVVEEFSKRFLKQPAVVWISDSAKKIFIDDILNRTLKIDLDHATLLPDVILVDMVGPKIKIVFVEVVYSDGAITDQRREQFLGLLAKSSGGWTPEDAMFVTAYNDRQSRPVTKALRELAWDSFAWFKSEPDHLVQMHNGNPRLLASL